MGDPTFEQMVDSMVAQPAGLEGALVEAEHQHELAALMLGNALAGHASLPSLVAFERYTARRVELRRAMRENAAELLRLLRVDPSGQ